MGGATIISKNLCDHVHVAVRQLPVLPFPSRKDELPNDGLYILFEQGEAGHNGSRIVRIGSHTGIGNLPSRLVEHTKANKDRSIFRKNIGRALLNRAHDPFLEQWNWDLTSKKKRAFYGPRLDTNRQQEVEEAVTGYIVENFSFVVIAVEDRAARLSLEKALIATVAQCPRCKPSPIWLGNFSPVGAIRTSGLWLKQHLNGEALSRDQLLWLSHLP